MALKCGRFFVSLKRSGLVVKGGIEAIISESWGRASLNYPGS